jgi:PadR family transcriptional regulator PadR
MAGNPLGGFEQEVLVAVLRMQPEAFALEVRREIEKETGRGVSRGAFYTTLERLERKGLLVWEEARPSSARRSGLHRRFSVTPAGMETLREAYRAMEAARARLGQALEEG